MNIKSPTIRVISILKSYPCSDVAEQADEQWKKIQSTEQEAINIANRQQILLAIYSVLNWLKQGSKDYQSRQENS